MVSPNLHVRVPSLLIRLAAEKRLPFPRYRKEWVAPGALFSHAPGMRAIGRAASPTIDKLLQDIKPADFPVQQPMQFERIINLITAQAFGLTIPPLLLSQLAWVLPPPNSRW